MPPVTVPRVVMFAVPAHVERAVSSTLLRARTDLNATSCPERFWPSTPAYWYAFAGSEMAMKARMTDVYFFIVLMF